MTANKVAPTAAHDPLLLHSLLTCLTSALKAKDLDVSSPFAILTRGMEMLASFPELSLDQKKAYLVMAIEQVAKGPDGVLGTSDDLLPESTVTALKSMVDNNLIKDTFQLVVDAAQGKFHLDQAKAVGTKCVVALGPLLKSLFAKLTPAKKPSST